ATRPQEARGARKQQEHPGRNKSVQAVIHRLWDGRAIAQVGDTHVVGNLIDDDRLRSKPWRPGQPARDAGEPTTISAHEAGISRRGSARLSRLARSGTAPAPPAGPG